MAVSTDFPIRRPRRVTNIDFARLSHRVLKLAALLIIGAGIVGTIRADKYSASQWLDLLEFGLTLGSVYALIALGYTMVYGVLRLINFAHGDVMMVGTFIAYFVANALDRNGMFGAHPIIAFSLTLLVGAVASAVVALLLERFAYRPLRQRSNFSPLITSIGMSFFLQQSCRGAFGAGLKAYPDPAWLQGTFSFWGVTIPKIELIVLVVALATMAGLYLIVNRTKIGTAMRASSEDSRAAALMGVDVQRIVVFTFFLGGLTAGVGGVLYALIYKQVYFMMGFLPGVKAFGAAVLGGIGSIPGAMLGGFFLGLAETVGTSTILDGLGLPAPYQLRDLIAFCLLILVLILRPTGLLGEKSNRQRA